MQIFISWLYVKQYCSGHYLFSLVARLFCFLLVQWVSLNLKNDRAYTVVRRSVMQSHILPAMSILDMIADIYHYDAMYL